jgi:hypothetical protein
MRLVHGLSSGQYRGVDPDVYVRFVLGNVVAAPPPLLLLKHYSPLWTSASKTTLLNFLQALPLRQFLIPITFRNSSASSVHLFRSVVLFLVPSIRAVTMCFGILSSHILSVCPHHLHLRNFINFAMTNG